MPMFDNAIFASFIPQFLMILGFFSCIVAPSLSSKNNSEHLESISATNAITYQVESQSKTKIFSFQEYQKSTKKEVKINLSNYFSPTLETTKIVYPDFIVHWRRFEIISSLFSRPPPISLI
ncbi:hypothetical protein TRIP_D250032 [uncultured Paludibacter sp.]|uniref:Uncharacterized protein n=1 Tax=uncultured Paludibacter sp. TaxID=497635 RepID=A0A653A865_9BACT|nr:hypothetical protein TRIP_D250032 [uncultured Paludibacter sp.]